MIDLFYCKHCRSEFEIEFSDRLSGDAFVVCPVCGWQHSRQFVQGIAVSCNTPKSRWNDITLIHKRQI